MNICFVNWAPFGDKRAGGVSVYNNSLVSFLRDNTDSKVYTLSCGVSYNFFSKKVYFVSHGDDFSIINSSVVAPSHFSFFSRSQIRDEDTENAFCLAFEKMNSIAPLDIIHFNNFEGMPINALNKIKKKLPNTKIVFSIHNYYTLCPQVNLWYLESTNCTNFNGGKKCINCLPNSVRSTSVKKAYFLDEVLKKANLKPSSKVYNSIWSFSTKIHSVSKKFESILIKQKKETLDSIENENLSISKDYFSDRRVFFKDIINKNVDLNLGVSQRVSDIYKKHGYNNVSTLYIGTKYADNMKDKTEYLDNKKIKSIGYMGYMRRDKGFYFLINALRNFDTKIAGNIDLVIAAKNTDNHMYWQIKNLTKKFNNVYYFDGYTEKNIEKIMSHIDVGIIPSQWEDNLPQVAIEYHSKKIPILCSNLGGASELNAKNEEFIFNYKSQKELLRKINNLVSNGYNEKNYWENTLPIFNIKNHASSLLNAYEKLKCN